jgi:hypothetical protein
VGKLGEPITSGEEGTLVEEADSDRIPLSRDQTEAIESSLSCDKSLLGRLILVDLVKKLRDEEDHFSGEEDAAAWRVHGGSVFVHVA